MQERCPLELGRPVGLPLLVNQQWKMDARFVAKSSRVREIAEADGGEPSPLLQKRLLVIAQLRDVLTAENSPVMPKEYEHRRPVLPQRAQPNQSLVAVRQRNVRQPLTQWLLHTPFSRYRSELSIPMPAVRFARRFRAGARTRPRTCPCCRNDITDSCSKNHLTFGHGRL